MARSCRSPCCSPSYLWRRAPPRRTTLARLREQIAAQQKQLDQQRQALESAQKALVTAQAAIDSQQKLLDQLVAARSAPAAAATQPIATPPAAPPAEANANGRDLSPLSFRIGGAEFAPGGFMDFSTVWRSTNIGSGVATSFAAVPFSNTAAGRMQEFRSSAANSRITLTITENPTPNLSLMGYLEGDFYGNQPASLYVTSNSNTWRMRHFWVNVSRGKWEVLGGQTWTLLTPNRFAVSPVSSNVFVGLGEDSNYMTGLVWGRPGQLRVVYHPNYKWSIAASVENPEQFVTTATTLPAFAATQVDNGSVSTTPNVRPDIVAKIAYDTRLSGKALHFELAGFSRQFRTSPAPGQYYDAQGVGGSTDAVLEVAKNFRLIATGFYSSGGGRYLVGLGPDFIVGPDGSISPVHSMAGIAGFEYAPNRQIAVLRLLRRHVFRPELHDGRAGALSGVRLPGLVFGQPAVSGTRVRLLLHLLEEPEIRRAAAHYGVCLPDAGALVRGVWILRPRRTPT